jgi:putative FmdB family regulatory protein
MPIYEFYCDDCRKKVEVFRRTVSAAGGERCPACGGERLRRLISRFAVHRSGDVVGSADEAAYLDGLENEDPRAMAAFARRMQREGGEDLGPEFGSMVSRMEAGELPDEMDGFGDDDGDDFDDDF